MLQLGLCGSIGYMGDVKSPDLGGDPEGDEAVVTERAGVHEARVRVTLKHMLSEDNIDNYPTQVRQAPHRRRRWLKMRLS